MKAQPRPAGSSVERGAKVVQVNPAATDLDDVACFNLRGAAGMVMDRLVRAVVFV